MARMIKRKCCMCGKNYETYCPSCREAAYQPSWLNSFDTENCAKVYEACAGYSGHAYTKEEANVLLKMCDLSDRANFTESTQRILNELLTEEKKEKSVKKTNEETVKESHTDSTQNDKVEEHVTKKSVYNRNKKNRKK